MGSNSLLVYVSTFIYLMMRKLKEQLGLGAAPSLAQRRHLKGFPFSFPKISFFPLLHGPARSFLTF